MNSTKTKKYKQLYWHFLHVLSASKCWIKKNKIDRIKRFAIQKLVFTELIKNTFQLVKRFLNTEFYPSFSFVAHPTIFYRLWHTKINIHIAEFSIALCTNFRATNKLSFYLIQLFIDNRIIHIYRRDCFEVSRRLPYVFWIQYAEPPAPLGSRPMHMYYLFRLNMTFEYIDNIWLYVVLSLHLLLR